MVLEQMDPQTVSRLIDHTSNALADLVKDRMTMRQRKAIMEEQMEQEKELARIRNNAKWDEDDSGAEATETSTTSPKPPEPEPERTVVKEPKGDVVDFDAVMDETECGMCQAMLKYIRSLDDPQERAKGLSAFGEMKRAMETGESKQEVREVIDNHKVLKDALKETAT